MSSSRTRSTLLTCLALAVWTTAATALCVVCGCGPVDPPRPTSVPASATWCGGPEGGAWVDCTSLGAGVVRCSIYADASGYVIDSGTWHNSAESRARYPRMSPSSFPWCYLHETIYDARGLPWVKQ